MLFQSCTTDEGTIVLKLSVFVTVLCYENNNLSLNNPILYLIVTIILLISQTWPTNTYIVHFTVMHTWGTERANSALYLCQLNH